MSLYDNVLDEMEDTVYLVKVWDWVRSQINMPKFRARAYSAKKYPDVQVKVVLMEYSSTYRSGDSTTHYYVPGTGVNTRCLQYDRNVLDYLHYQIADRDPDVVVYSRRKIVDGVPHPFLRQLVVKFNATPNPPLPKEEPPSDIDPLDSDSM